MNWVINIAETEVFHNKFTKKIKKVVILFSTLTSSHLYDDHGLEKNVEKRENAGFRYSHRLCK